MSQACCTQGPVDPMEEKMERRSFFSQMTLASICLTALAISQLSTWIWPSFPKEAQTFLYLAAYLSGGFYPLCGVVQDLRAWKFNVNFLMVAAALGAAFIGQVLEGAILMFLFSLSGALENFAIGRTRKAIRSLLKLSPSEATILVGGEEKNVPVSSLKIGEVLIVRPGQSFAVDGVILEGTTSVDESSLTGESIPVDRGPGSRVMAGTLNRYGSVKVKMDREVSDTTLAKIFKIVEEAQQQKAPTQRWIEQYGGPYTAFVILATLFTFLGGLYWINEPWQRSLYRAMTLMVVASPCALVLSIPSAILAAIATGARNGILFKGGRAVEIIGQVKAVAFDKTGTLTLGKPQLAEARYTEEVSPSEIMSQVAALEQHSEHPLAQVIVQKAKEQNISFSNISNTKAVPGMGMEGQVNKSRLRIGSEAFVCIHGGMEPWVRETVVEYRSRGLTCLIAANEKPLAVFGVCDQLRPGAIAAVQKLQAMGVESIMLTGDHAATAAEFARQLEIKDFRAGLLPHQKVEVLRDLTQRYQTVAMVGDGINDAPALVSASIGIAMKGSASDVALENADIVLMSEDIERVPEIIQLGRQTQRIIFQNIIFALSVIFLLIASTFFGGLTLATGVIGHEGSTLVVVFNSLRLLNPSFLQRRRISS